MTAPATAITSPEHIRRLHAALSLREIPDYPAALAQLQKAALLAPDEASVQLLLGLTYEDLGNLELAEQHLRQASLLDSKSNDIRQALGTLLVQQGEYQQAIDYLRPVVQADVYNQAAARAMAAAQANLGNYPVAIGVLKAAYEHNPKDVDLLEQLGHLLLEYGQPDEALPYLQQVITLRPSPEALCELAAAHTMREEFEPAITLLQQAQQQRPRYDRAWRGLAYCYLKLSEIDKASEAAETALNIDDRHFRNWQVKADVLLEQDQIEEAIKALDTGIYLSNQASDGLAVLNELLIKRAIEILRRDGPEIALEQIEKDKGEFPSGSGLLSLQRDILLSQNEYAQALKVVNEAATRGIPKEDLAFDYYQIYHALGQPDQALEAIKPLPIDSDELSEFIEALHGLGVRLYERGQISATRSIFEQTLKLQPGSPNSLNNLGFVLAGEGEWDKAEMLFRQALDHGINTPEVTLANLGYVYLRRGEYDLAIQLLSQSEEQLTAGDQSILRIAFWRNNSFSETPYDLHPVRHVPALAAVRANLATAFLLKGEAEIALAKAKAAIEVAPDDTVGYKALGCVYLSTGKSEAARSVWEEALKRHKTKRGAEIIQNWLKDLSTP